MITLTDTHPDSDYQGLKKWNLVMALIHLVQGVALLLLAKTSTFAISWNLPKPVFTGQGRPPTVPLQMEKWFDVNLAYCLAAFLFVCFVAHLICAVGKSSDWYISMLKKRLNLIRWYEYAISSSLMVFAIAILCGITDAGILILLVGINASMNLFGATMELYNSKRRELAEATGTEYTVSWAPFWYGVFAGILPWVVMGVYFFVSLDRLSNLSDLPQKVKDILNNVRFIFPLLFVFFNCFAINMYLQYKGIGKWKDYLFGEKAYIILSLTAKSVLAWFVFGGTLR
jgi:hypothetical protein